MKALRKPLSLFMALLMCLGVFVGTEPRLLPQAKP